MVFQNTAQFSTVYQFTLLIRKCSIEIGEYDSLLYSTDTMCALIGQLAGRNFLYGPLKTET